MLMSVKVCIYITPWYKQVSTLQVLLTASSMAGVPLNVRLFSMKPRHRTPRMGPLQSHGPGR